VIIFIVRMPAWFVLIWYFALQVLMGLPQLSQAGDLTGGTAVWAHVGGFLAGALLIRWFERPDLVARRRAILLQRGLLAPAERLV
jgi:membrane associated rhomboid family serine protease